MFSSKKNISPEINMGEVRSLSMFQQSWIQFKRNKMAVVGMIVVCLLILISLGTLWGEICSFASCGEQDFPCLSGLPQS